MERYLIAVYQTASQEDKELSSTFFYELADGVVKVVYSRFAEYLDFARASTYHILYISEWYGLMGASVMPIFCAGSI